MLFENTECTMPKEIRTQYEEGPADSWEIVEDCIFDMFDDDDDFVVLTIADISHNVRYVQARQQDGGIIVQLGVEVEGGTRLVEKLFSKDECMAIFREFYETTNVQNVDQYTEVKFQ